MKKRGTTYAVLAAVLSIFLLGFTAGGPFFDDAMSACENSWMFRLTVWFFEFQDYEVESLTEVPINYLVPPVGDYVAANVICTMVRTPDVGTGTDYSVITTEITYYVGKGYKASRVSTEQFTVD